MYYMNVLYVAIKTTEFDGYEDKDPINSDHFMNKMHDRRYYASLTNLLEHSILTPEHRIFRLVFSKAVYAMEDFKIDNIFEYLGKLGNSPKITRVTKVTDKDLLDVLPGDWLTTMRDVAINWVLSNVALERFETRHKFNVMNQHIFYATLAEDGDTIKESSRVPDIEGNRIAIVTRNKFNERHSLYSVINSVVIKLSDLKHKIVWSSKPMKTERRIVEGQTGQALFDKQQVQQNTTERLLRDILTDKDAKIPVKYKERVMQFLSSSVNFGE
ncbi:hypothetical protein KNT64_gp036 [Pseudomonas phage PspYZU05]|uniref:Uncharacterized protein n=1 Tax=Pseudomonas phage PspYZU05 TaxID=1983556 RepID=A0A2U7NLS1_9CAUD|nr:hypothetical protein KNT64_gp036 [Pseudomonas phage PspYZU05]ASD51988.1 hypothetical protein PspYZU05_36 [Pseudomonas phage PspYZU05]